MRLEEEFKLVLVGQSSPKKDMDDTETILATIKQLQLQDHVKLPGYLSEEDLKVYYKNASMYVFPSLNEGFGLPVLESFYHSLPLLISNNSCLPEVAGDAALTFDPVNIKELADKMRMLIVDEKLRLKLIKKGKERLELYSWEKTASELIEAFRKVVD